MTDYENHAKFQYDLIANNLLALINAKSVDDAKFLRETIKMEIDSLCGNVMMNKFGSIDTDLLKVD